MRPPRQAGHDAPEFFRAWRPRRGRGLLLLLLFTVGVFCRADAAIITVTTTNNSGPGSLRLAITTANQFPDHDTIQFNFTNAGPFTISPISPLPDLVHPVTIDGTTQAGFAGTPIIELNGAGIGSTDSGLVITGGGCTIRGLVINRFGRHGLLLNGGGTNTIVGNYLGTDVAGATKQGNAHGNLAITNSAGNLIGGTNVADRNLIAGSTTGDGVMLAGTGTRANVIQGNFIGTDVTGTLSLGNDKNGLWIGSGASSNLVGGTAAGAGNLISGNLDDGVEIQDADATGNVLEGNFIGTDATGTARLPNESDGVLINDAPGNTVGGVTSAARNIISANLDSGIHLAGTNATNNLMLGNLIGPDVSGLLDLGNGVSGVLFNKKPEGGPAIGDPGPDRIGGTLAGEGNVIAFNGEDGVSIEHGTGLAVLGNSIFSNNFQGITLRSNANNQQAFPVLSSALISVPGTMLVLGALHSAANSTYRIELFANLACEASGYGEGRTLLGATNVTTDATGDAVFNVALGVGISNGVVTATATAADGSTSEFSLCEEIVDASTTLPVLTLQPVGQTVPEGTNVTLTVTATSFTPLTYQWGREGMDLPGATNATLTLTNVAQSDAGRFVVLVRNTAGSVLSQEVLLTVLPVPPVITLQPVSRTVNEGTNVSFTVTATSPWPVTYQWGREGMDLLGETNATLTLTNVAPSDAGRFVVLVRNPSGSVLSDSAVLTVLLMPPTFTLEPASQTAVLGSTVTLLSAATGSAPLQYSWQHNGMSLPGQNAATLTLTNLQNSDAGTYRVTVTNEQGSATSAAANLRVVRTALAMTDDFSLTIGSLAFTGLGQASNTLATSEAGEPPHDGKPGGKSMWFTWVAPAGGVATFSTRDSDFDTLLAVYQGSTVEALTPVASDDDVAGFFHSQVRFNVESDQIYRIVVDGAGGASGTIVLQWSLDATSDRLPVITNQPLSQIVTPGANVTLTLGASGTALTYEWLFHNVIIPGATNDFLVLTNVGLESVGAYKAHVWSGSNTVHSRLARLQLRLSTEYEQDVLVIDKFRDMVAGGRPLQLDAPPVTNVVARGFGVASVSRGYSGSQVFSTVGSLKEPGEPDHCGIPGGASLWFAYQATTDGVIELNTDGSTFDTVLAVYTGSGADFASLTPLVCDNDSGTNGLTSSLHFITTSGTTYFVAIDGVNGASGTALLNYTTLGERQPPAVQITSAPPANARLTNGTVVLQGTAADTDDEVILVEWRLTNSLGATAWVPATGTNAWTLTASELEVGPNTVQIRSMDTWANVSPLVSRRYVRLAPLTVEIDGCGSVSQGFPGTSFREVGTTVSLTATPCGNSLFAGWSGDAATNGATLKFLMPTGLVVRANFVTNQFTARRGNYAGLFCDTNLVAQNSAGFVSLRTTSKGTYSGRLRLGSKSHTFSGRLGLDGLGTNSVRRGGTNPPFRLELNLNLGESVEWLAGRVLATNWTADLTAYRAVFHSRTNRAPYRGRYTLVLPASGFPGTPEGDGYATVTVSSGGSARLSGTLADGTALSQGAAVAREGWWPVYAPLHKGRGSIWGWLTFTTNSFLIGTNVVPSDLEGDWRWLKPASSTTRYYPGGFTNRLGALGSRYTAPAGTNGALSFSNGAVEFHGGNLSGPFTNGVLHSRKDRVTNLETNRLTLTITRSNGRFQGTAVVPATGRKIPFKGILFQNGDFGLGYSLQTNASGAVWFGSRE